jgi:hypothetical protein
MADNRESRRFEHPGQAWSCYHRLKELGRNPTTPMGGPGSSPGWYILFDRAPIESSSAGAADATNHAG